MRGHASDETGSVGINAGITLSCNRWRPAFKAFSRPSDPPSCPFKTFSSPLLKGPLWRMFDTGCCCSSERTSLSMRYDRRIPVKGGGQCILANREPGCCFACMLLLLSSGMISLAPRRSMARGDGMELYRNSDKIFVLLYIYLKHYKYVYIIGIYI